MRFISSKKIKWRSGQGLVCMARHCLSPARQLVTCDESGMTIQLCLCDRCSSKIQAGDGLIIGVFAPPVETAEMDDSGAGDQGQPDMLAL